MPGKKSILDIARQENRAMNRLRTNQAEKGCCEEDDDPLVDLNGIYTGNGLIPSGTVATADGDFLVSRTIGGTDLNFALDIIGAVTPFARFYTTDPINGNAIIGVADDTVVHGAPLSSLVAVYNSLGVEYASFRAQYLDGTNTYSIEISANSQDTAISDILIEARSVAGNSSIDLVAAATGAGTALITLVADDGITNTSSAGNFSINIPLGDLEIDGNTGATGSFTAQTGEVVTVTKGIITSIV